MRLAGAHRDRIFGDAEAALGDGWPVGSEPRDIYGDGRASEKILQAILRQQSIWRRPYVQQQSRTDARRVLCAAACAFSAGYSDWPIVDPYARRDRGCLRRF